MIGVNVGATKGVGVSNGGRGVFVGTGDWDAHAATVKSMMQNNNIFFDVFFMGFSSSLV